MFKRFWRRLYWTRHLEPRIPDFEIQKNITENYRMPILLKIKPRVYEIYL